MNGIRSALVVLLLLLCAAPTDAATASSRSGPEPVGVWPLVPEPEVVEGFDPPATQYGAGHRGVDLAGSVGQPVRTALPGRVTYAGLLAGRGVVVVSHGDTRTTYQPVHAVVPVGEQVSAGTIIGTLQLGGSHCFPRACLHWGWLRGETYLDPLRLVGAGSVRLLPLWRKEPAGQVPVGRLPGGRVSVRRMPVGRPLVVLPRPLACTALVHGLRVCRARLSRRAVPADVAAEIRADPGPIIRKK